MQKARRTSHAVLFPYAYISGAKSACLDFALFYLSVIVKNGNLFLKYGFSENRF